MKITNGAKVHSLKETKYGTCVDIELSSMRTTRDVYWSPAWESSHGRHGGCNSYVVFANEDGVAQIASVNGAGEIRWVINEWQAEYAFKCEREFPNAKPSAGDWVEQLAALKHFGVEF